jgi:hypothetical protein
MAVISLLLKKKKFLCMGAATLVENTVTGDSDEMLLCSRANPAVSGYTQANHWLGVSCG